MTDRDHNFYPPPKGNVILAMRGLIFPALIGPAFGMGLMLPMAIRDWAFYHTWMNAFYVVSGFGLLALTIALGFALRFMLAQCAAWAPRISETQT